MKIITVLIFAVLASNICASADIVVLVNSDNPTSDLSLNELKRIYLGKQASFTKDLPIKLGADTNVSDIFYQIVLNMSPHRVKKHWIKAVFAGERSAPPMALTSQEKMSDFLKENRGAIVFADSSIVPSTGKVISIMGFHPDEENYPLKSAEEEQHVAK